MKALPAFFISLCLSPLLTTPVFAELYQWKDENGHVHFSDKKPGSSSGNVNTLQQPDAQRPSGRKAGDEGNSSGNATPSQERQKRLLQVMKQEAEQKEQAQRTADKNREQQEAQCRKLREHQNSIAGRRLFHENKKDEHGDPVYLDDKERDAYEQKIATTIAENCP